MTEQPLEYYVDRYVRGIITRDEIAVLRRLLNDPVHTRLLDALMEEELNQWKASDLQFHEVVERVQQGVAQKIAMKEETAMPLRRISVLHSKWFRYAAVAVVVLGVGILVYVLNSNKQQKEVIVAKTEELKKDIEPGRKGAVLTLADGSQMVLDSLSHGVIATQNGSKVLLNEGQVAYDPANEMSAELVYNSMVTPKGRQFQLTLPDGTSVWLNAASSLRYPVAFTGSERKVFVTGEAYFEVAKNEKMPFLVEVNNKTIVEVLGTKFNVNAYDDEPDLRTTLEQGSVRLRRGGQSVLLKPGQQARITEDGKINVTDDPDMSVTLSWKTDRFKFMFTKQEAVLRQLSRWYDVEVVYDKEIPGMEFKGGIEGEIGKDLNLSEAVDVLRDLGIKCRVEGKKLIVMP